MERQPWHKIVERGLSAPFWALDLCSGEGGITAGMQAAGFRTLGVDIKQHKGYPGPCLLQDVRSIDRLCQWHILGGPQWAWVHCSPPCQRFSKARPSRVKDPPSDKDTDILRACLDLKDDLDPPFWSVENVSGAVPFFEPYLGKPRYVHGPFYFWGNFPAFLSESSGLKKNMSNWGLDPATGERTWGVKKASDGTVNGAGRRSRTPIEITRPMAKAIHAALRPELAALQPTHSILAERRDA